MAEVAESSLQESLELHDNFQEALESSQRLALEEFAVRCEELLAKLDAKREEFDKHCADRSNQLGLMENAFEIARQEALQAAEQLQSVQAEMDAHRAQGQAQLQDIRASLKDLLSAVKGATTKHLVLGTTLVVLHLGIIAVAAKKSERH